MLRAHVNHLFVCVCVCVCVSCCARVASVLGECQSIQNDLCYRESFKYLGVYRFIYLCVCVCVCVLCVCVQDIHTDTTKQIQIQTPSECT